MDYIDFQPRDVSDGTTNEPLDKRNIPMHMAIAAFTGIAWCNVVELNIAVYMVFRKKSGLYFWSVFLSIQGIMLHSVAFILKLYGVVSLYQVTVSMVTVGWYLMVTGQSLVLYSRLHLIVSETWIIRGVLIMIVSNAILLHIPTTVLTYGTNSPDFEDYHSGYRIMEKLQMTIFCVQELIISGIYIWATLNFLRPFYRRQIRSVMLQLLWINIGIIIMDVAMLTIEYLGFYSLEVAMKGAIYSVKLKIEFAVLNQLMRIAKSSRETRVSASDDASDPASQNGKGFKGLLRRILPQPNNDTTGDGNGFIGGMGALKTNTAERKQRQAQANGNMSVISSHKVGEGNDRRERCQGISVTREVTQISNKMDSPNEGRSRLQGKPNEYYPGSRNSRDTSIDIDGAHSDRSELELVDVPSPYEGATCEEVETVVPRRTAQLPWRGVSTVRSRGISPH